MEALIVILFIVLLLGGVFLAPKLKTEIGILFAVMAYVIGRWGYGLTTKEIAAFVPADIIIIILAVNLFFGYARKVGVTQGFADRLLYMTKDRPKLLPFIIIVACFVLGTVGAGAYGICAIMSPIVFSLVAEVGLNPLLGVCSMFAGATLSQWAWTDAGALGAAMVENFVMPGAGFVTQLKVQLCTLIIFAILYTILYLCMKNKIRNTSFAVSEPKPFTKQQKQVIAVLLAIILIIIIPMIVEAIVPNPVTAWMKNYLEIRILFLLGTVILGLLNMGDSREVVAQAPWGLLVMISGATMFVSLSTTMGVTDTLVNFVSTTLPTWLVGGAILLVCGLIGMFVNGIVVLTAFLPMVDQLSAAAGLTPIGLTIGMLLAITLPAFSPFSTGGAVCLIGCTDDKIRDPLIRKQLICAFVLLGVLFLVGISGILKIF